MRSAETGDTINSKLFLMFVLQNGVRYLLELKASSKMVGVFSVYALTLGRMRTVVTSAVIMAWNPWTLEQAKDWNRSRHFISFRFNHVRIGFTRAVFGLRGCQAFTFYHCVCILQCWSVVGLYATSTFAISVFSLLLTRLYIMKKIYLVIVPQFFAAATALICFLYLFDHGPVGAALSVLIGTTILIIVQCLLNHILRSVKALPLNYLKLTSASLFSGFGLVHLQFSVHKHNFLLVFECFMLACLSVVLGLHFPAEVKDLTNQFKGVLKNGLL